MMAGYHMIECKIHSGGGSGLGCMDKYLQMVSLGLGIQELKKVIKNKREGKINDCKRLKRRKLGMLFLFFYPKL